MNKSRFEIYEVCIASLALSVAYLYVVLFPLAPLSREEAIERGMMSSARVMVYKKDTRLAVQGGSGFIIGKKDGTVQILTNAHIVMVGGENIDDIAVLSETVDYIVTLADGKEYSGALILLRKPELALLEINASEEEVNRLAVAKLWDPNKSVQKKLKMGNEVCAIGAPFSRLSSTCGVLSKIDDTFGSEVRGVYGIKGEILFRTDAAINPGNSGGMLILVETAEVVGIVTMKNYKREGMAFAIRSTTILRILHETMWRKE